MPFEKIAGYKAAFDFRAQINAEQRAQRATKVPLFTIPDNSVKTRLLVDIILGECGAEVDPSANYVGWGSDISPSVFRPLKHGPTVEVSYED